MRKVRIAMPSRSYLIQESSLKGCLLTVAALFFATATAGPYGCTSTNRNVSIPPESRRIQLPKSGELEVHARALPPVGDVLLVRVSITNLAPTARVLPKQAVGGITESGKHVAALSLKDPAIVRNAPELLRVVSGGESAFGAALSKSGGWGWALATGPIAWTCVAISSAVIASKSADERLALYQLKSGPFFRDKAASRSGYIFLPNQDYVGIEVTVKNLLTHNEEAIEIPWNSAADLSIQHVSRESGARQGSVGKGP